MNKLIREMLETRHNVYIDPKTDQFNLSGYDEQYGWRPIPEDWTTCECCGNSLINDDDEIADEMLCDKCSREINCDA